MLPLYPLFFIKKTEKSDPKVLLPILRQAQHNYCRTISSAYRTLSNQINKNHRYWPHGNEGFHRVTLAQIRRNASLQGIDDHAVPRSSTTFASGSGAKGSLPDPVIFPGEPVWPTRQARPAAFFHPVSARPQAPPAIGPQSGD